MLEDAVIFAAILYFHCRRCFDYAMLALMLVSLLALILRAACRCRFFASPRCYFIFTFRLIRHGFDYCRIVCAAGHRAAAAIAAAIFAIDVIVYVDALLSVIFLACS